MQEVNVAILGMGTVGGGIYRLIEQEADNIEHKDGIRLRVKKTLALAYSVDVPEEKRARDIDEIINDPEIQIVAEVMEAFTRLRTLRSRLSRQARQWSAPIRT